MEENGKNNDIVRPVENLSFLLSESPAMQDLLQPVTGPQSWVNDRKIRRLYLQASAQQWFAPQRINFDQPIELDEETRRVWIRISGVFYTLEKMGLHVIENMMAKAMRKLKSEEIAFYLASQCHDEARHVFAVENYLKKLGATPKYDRTYHIFSQVASLGAYRVENWLFSTLFSENFASAFLRRAKSARIDPVGADMSKSILLDESRHIHFLHIVLPDILDRLSLFGRTYVKMSQFFIMKFTSHMASSFDKDAALVGIDTRALLEEVYENVERAYDSFGVTRKFLYFPKLGPVSSPL